MLLTRDTVRGQGSVRVEVSDGVSLSSDEIVETVRRGRVHETVTDPFASLYGFGNLGLELERLLDTFIVEFFAAVESLLVRVAIETENVERVFSSDRDEVASS